jgi:hypothetical protein
MSSLEMSLKQMDGIVASLASRGLTSLSKPRQLQNYGLPAGVLLQEVCNVGMQTLLTILPKSYACTSHTNITKPTISKTPRFYSYTDRLDFCFFQSSQAWAASGKPKHAASKGGTAEIWGPKVRSLVSWNLGQTRTHCCAAKLVHACCPVSHQRKESRSCTERSVLVGPKYLRPLFCNFRHIRGFQILSVAADSVFRPK